jgi:hypothetical protein
VTNQISRSVDSDFTVLNRADERRTGRSAVFCATLFISSRIISSLAARASERPRRRASVSRRRGDLRQVRRRVRVALADLRQHSAGAACRIRRFRVTASRRTGSGAVRDTG